MQSDLAIDLWVSQYLDSVCCPSKASDRCERSNHGGGASRSLCGSGRCRADGSSQQSAGRIIVLDQVIISRGSSFLDLNNL